MTHTPRALLFAFILLAVMVLLLEMGRRFGIRRSTVDEEGVKAGAGAVEGAVFGLLGLLLAFTFSGAAGRFDTRRLQIVDEANAVGTAYLRLDLLPEGERPALQELFRRYLDTRLAAYRQLPDFRAARRGLAQSMELQGLIWSRAVGAVRMEGASRSAEMLLLPALNQMFDIAATRTAMMRMHPPHIIYVMLVMLSLLGSLLAGYGMARARTRGWFHILGFTLIMTASIYIILDLEFPRLGLIRIDRFDQLLVDVRDGMK